MSNKYGFHGDLHVISVTSIPKDAEATKETVLEYGEVTGHAHRLNGDAGDAFTVFKTKAGAKFLHVVRPVDLSHEEHATRVIQPGDYEIRRTREADHMSGVTRLVAD